MNGIAVSGALALIFLSFIVKVQCDSNEVLEDSMARLAQDVVKLEEAAKKLQYLKNSLPEEEELMCMVLTNVDKDLVKEAKLTYTVPADNRAYKKYLSCCWQQLDYQYEDGDIQWDNIRVVLEDEYPTDAVDTMIERCNGTNGVTAGDTVALVLRCLDENVFVTPNATTDVYSSENMTDY